MANFLFHSLVEDVLEEDLASDARPKPIPLITWLDERQNDPAQVYTMAASHYHYHSGLVALEAVHRPSDSI